MADRHAAPRRHSIAEQRAAAAPRILVAEDHPASQRITMTALEHLGFSVDVVANGAEAVYAAAPRRYRAILMDCQLPILNGFEATSEIRRLQGRADHTPIIAVTVETSESDRQRCRAAGMDDFLAKPLSRTSLAATLERWAPDAGWTAALAPTPSLPPFGASAALVDDSSPEPIVEVLDPDVIGRLEALGQAAGIDLIGQLADLFIIDADAIVVEMRRAFVVDDSQALTRAIHALGSASVSLGAVQLADLCHEWEAHTIPGALLGGRARLHAVEAALDLVRPALEEYRCQP